MLFGNRAYVGGNIRFAIGISDSNKNSLAASNSNDNKFVIDKNGRVGIAQVHLIVHTNCRRCNNCAQDTRMMVYFVTPQVYMTTRAYQGGLRGSRRGNHYYSLQIDARDGYIFSKFERVTKNKENIVEVNDNAALQKVRDISCCWYNYIDKYKIGSERVIGFIAQQVKTHLPEAINITHGIIPNVMRIIDVSWNKIITTDEMGNESIKYKMTSNELYDVSGVKYKFYLSNDIYDDDDMEIMKEVIGNEDNSFTFDTSYNNVFCFGMEVDDFHTLEKDKIFALNFSATQEIDRIQQAEKIKLKNTNIQCES